MIHECATSHYAFGKLTKVANKVEITSVDIILNTNCPHCGQDLTSDLREIVAHIYAKLYEGNMK